MVAKKGSPRFSGQPLEERRGLALEVPERRKKSKDPKVEARAVGKTRFVLLRLRRKQ